MARDFSAHFGYDYNTIRVQKLFVGYQNKIVQLSKQNPMYH